MSIPEAGAVAGDVPVSEEEPPRLLSKGWARSAPRSPTLLEFGSRTNFYFGKK